MSNLCRIMLADNQAMVRSGMRLLLEQNHNMEVVAEAATGELAYQMYGKSKPDIVLMDMAIPAMGGLQAMRRILLRYAGARVIISSTYENITFATQALGAGAKGYVSKSGATADLMNVMYEVMGGRTWISPSIAKQIAMQSIVGEDDPLRQLSSREFEIFRSLAEGHAVEVIAEKLKIGKKSVANYQTLLRQKLGLSSPVELVRLAMRHGVIESWF